jgi:HSP20 family molecular chaperone IbpA
MALIYPPYPYWEPYPTTYLNETCPQPGSHPHHHRLPHWSPNYAKRLHENEDQVYQPRADVVETPSAFHIDVELPGLEHKADLTLKWLSSRTILVSCVIRRKVVPGEEVPTTVSNGKAPQDINEGAAAKKEEKKLTSLAGHPVNGAPAPIQKTVDPSTTLHLTVRERNIGHISRAFNFPVDVEHKKTKGRLSGGLLTLVVLKKDHEQIPEHEIDVEFENDLAPWFKD